ncbi:hypothetical protein RsTz2092_07040 [Deferribacterales bacterium RsTz2092]|nr:hypothetical protein AGMMS49941_07970 [Deferribacterales bacterium]
MKILVIDDEKNICIAIQGIMQDEGYECEYRLNFEDGFNALKDGNFDILFLDIWLPDKDGTHGLREIKRQLPNVEVVMISGHGSIENAVDSIRWGAYDFLEKPLSLERILLITKHIQEKINLKSHISARKTLKEAVAEFEHQYIADTHKETGGNLAETARLLGISQAELEQKR